EVLEFIVHSACEIAGIPLRKMNFPRNAIVAGVVRGEQSFIANGETTIEAGDRVVVFTLPGAVHKVEKFFK
ncbi:MAG: TrkA C-terminal domain-containing protein, partial [Bacteroidota bacterium]